MIFLLRHDTVDAEDLCYGQTDLLPAVPAAHTAAKVREELPPAPATVISSPLQRCWQLADALFPNQLIEADTRAQEIHFGDWENQHWSALPREALDTWAKTPVDFEFPNGESMTAFSQRVEGLWQHLQSAPKPAVLVTHAGVIRRLIALASGSPWEEVLGLPVPFGGLFVINNGTVGQVSLPEAE